VLVSRLFQESAFALAVPFIFPPLQQLRSMLVESSSLVSLVEIPVGGLSKISIFSIQSLSIVFARLPLLLQLLVAFLDFSHLPVHHRIAVLVALVRDRGASLRHLDLVLLLMPRASLALDGRL